MQQNPLLNSVKKFHQISSGELYANIELGVKFLWICLTRQ